MKILILSFLLMIISIEIEGQTVKTDSLRNAMRSDARWAITHGEYVKGENILDGLIIDEPNNHENYFSKAKIYYFQKKLDSLTVCLDKALSLSHDSMRVYREFYRYYSFQFVDHEKCLDYINKMIKLQPNNSKLYMERSGIWVDIRNYDNSFKDIEKAASLGNEEAKQGLEYIIETRKKLKEKGIIK